MELIGKVIIGVDPQGPYARDALVTLARAGAAVAVAAGEGSGSGAEDIANRVRRRGGKASVTRLAKDGWGGKMIRDVVGEFGRVDAILSFSTMPQFASDQSAWRGFLAGEAARPADLLAGLKQARYPAEERSVSVIGVLLAAAPSPLTGAWAGLWRGIAASFTPETTGVRGIFTGLVATGVRENPGETVLSDGLGRYLTLLVSDQGMPMRGQVITFAQKPAEAEAPTEEEAPPAEPERVPIEKGRFPAGGKKPSGYRSGRGTKQTR
jgi:hypothetical protein